MPQRTTAAAEGMGTELSIPLTDLAVETMIETFEIRVTDARPTGVGENMRVSLRLLGDLTTDMSAVSRTVEIEGMAGGRAEGTEEEAMHVPTATEIVATPLQRNEVVEVVAMELLPSESMQQHRRRQITAASAAPRPESETTGVPAARARSALGIGTERPDCRRESRRRVGTAGISAIVGIATKVGRALGGAAAETEIEIVASTTAAVAGDLIKTGTGIERKAIGRRTGTADGKESVVLIEELGGSLRLCINLLKTAFHQFVRF